MIEPNFNRVNVFIENLVGKIFTNSHVVNCVQVVALEEELSEKKSALDELSAVNAENQLHIKELELKSSGLQSQVIIHCDFG